MRDELLGYYERELVFLRKMGADFARKYPKIASRLEIEEEKVEDPHVERIVEAFAFLTARVALKLDDELPEITESFLNILYPHYLAPIPSMAIAQFPAGSPKDKTVAVKTLPRGTKLNSKPVGGTPCQFRTASEVQIPPIQIESAALESPAPPDSRGNFAESSIRISLRCFGDGNLNEIKVDKTEKPPEFIRFYIDGDSQLVFRLYEIIFNHSTAVEFVPREAPLGNRTLKTISNLQLTLPDPVVIPASEALRPVGFSDDEAILPFTKRSFDGYRLLSEYFAFPYKFLFFDVYGLNIAAAKKFGSHFDIRIHLKDITPPAAPINADTFRVGCSPIVNLFSRLSDPLYVSNKKYEYQIVADVHRQSSTEIYSVDEVYMTDPRSGKTREFFPFYSMRHAYGAEQEKLFWYATRRASQRPNDDGTEVFMSFVDDAFDPKTPSSDVLGVKVTCSNRDLPSSLPFGGKEGDFEVEGAAVSSRVICLTKPTETIRPPMRRSIQWRLISHLNLNYVSLAGMDDNNPEALQEILHLYNFNNSAVTRKQIMGIHAVETRKAVRQLGERIGTGFVRGLNTTVTFDEKEFVGSGMYLFASVLDRFMGLYASVNSFNQLTVKTLDREEIVKQFPARAGRQALT